MKTKRLTESPLSSLITEGRENELQIPLLLAFLYPN